MRRCGKSFSRFDFQANSLTKEQLFADRGLTGRFVYTKDFAYQVLSYKF